MTSAVGSFKLALPTPGRWSLLWLGLIALTIVLMLARDSLPLAFQLSTRLAATAGRLDQRIHEVADQ